MQKSLRSPRAVRPSRPLRTFLVASVGLSTAFAALPAPATAQAAPAASAFGAEVVVLAEPAVGPIPVASVPAPTGDQTATVVDLPAEPVLINGTLTATANVHAAPDITSALTVAEHEVAGPYQARALGQVEGLALVFGVAEAGVPLLSAAVVRAEAVAVCGATPAFAATSEIIDLRIGGTSVPVNTPVEDIIDTITEVLETAGLTAVVDVQRNVVTPITGGGVSVDALVVTILAAAGEAPLADVRIAHAELTAGACAAPPQCSDGADNDADGVSDTDDPGCHTDGDATNPATYVPTDDDEANPPQCSDGADNDADGVSDTDDPGCHTDGDATDPATYDPTDDDETDAPVSPAEDVEADAAARVEELPRTGAASTGGAIGLVLLGLFIATQALRRRIPVS